jgi:hypothetical protein
MLKLRMTRDGRRYLVLVLEPENVRRLAAGDDIEFALGPVLPELGHPVALRIHAAESDEDFRRILQDFTAATVKTGGRIHFDFDEPGDGPETVQ